VPDTKQVEKIDFFVRPIVILKEVNESLFCEGDFHFWLSRVQ